MASIYLLTLKGLALNIERLLVFQNLCQVSNLEAFFFFLYFQVETLKKKKNSLGWAFIDGKLLLVHSCPMKKKKNGAFQGTLEDFIVCTVSELASY